MNAVVVRDFERARRAASDSDAARARGNVAGELHGLPITLKESNDVVGLDTTGGNPARVGNRAEVDGPNTRRVRGAGAIILGKTNVVLGMKDWRAFNAVFGTTSNPWDGDRSPGGSAAAVAAGFTALEIGGDVGGSVRIPAAFCGVLAHKATVPSLHASFTTELGTPGPIARSAADIRLLFDVMAHDNASRSRGWRLQLQKPRFTSLADARVAIWDASPLAPVADDIRARLSEVGDELSTRGATVSYNARPDFSEEEALYSYVTMMYAGFSTGHQDEDAHRGRTSELEATIPSGDRYYEALLAGHAIPHWEYGRVVRSQTAIRAAWDAFFRDWDVLLMPAFPTLSVPHDHRPMPERRVVLSGREMAYEQQIFWVGLPTFANLPSTALPLGLSSGGLPIGCQAVGNAFNDLQTIEFARLYAQDLGGFSPPPGFG